MQISTGSYHDFLERIIELSASGRSSYTCIANVHMLVEAHADPAFASVVNEADLITPDGVPLTWGLKLLHAVKQERVAGMDILPDLLQEAETRQVPVFFYGGTDEMMKKAASTIAEKFPRLPVAGYYAPPFRTLSAAEEQEVIQTINGSGARLVFVVLGCPKQEKWMHAMKGRIMAAMIGIGGALPVFAKMQKRAPEWMRRIGMEWFFRLCLEPRRLFKRYFVTNTRFLFLLTKEWMKMKWRRKHSGPGIVKPGKPVTGK